MRIWLISTGEPWPTDAGTPRLVRSAINARHLAAQGHKVSCWSGTFDHAGKRERHGRDGVWDSGQGFDMIGLYAGGYRSNISFRRIAYHARLARAFARIAPTRKEPDIIVASLTPLELCDAALAYGRKRNIPVIVDIRDLWPDVWREQIPPLLRPLGAIALKPFYAMLDRVLRGASAITGTTDSMIEWGLSRVGRRKTARERAFPLAHDGAALSAAAIHAAQAFWRARGIGQAGDATGCFFGTYSRRQDFRTVLDGIMALPAPLRARSKFVFCGAGEMGALIDAYAAHNPNIVNAGWVDGAQIRALMDLSQFGILPYRPLQDFKRSLPNKVFEYLAGGLPIVTCLRGEIGRLFACHACGEIYDADNADSFAAALVALADPARREMRAAEARAAARHYEADAICEGFEAYLREAVLRDAVRAAAPDISSRHARASRYESDEDAGVVSIPVASV